ncbi:MAG TPA: hypothetical protein VL225_05485 [Vicinamibacterales bacterium]|jgi:hypothetical protein|nr:hypothetical protein [Vicinamibacterales bacterium]
MDISLSGQSVAGDRRLIRYLLGALPDEEAERLDEQSIVDEGMAARLRILEDDLVDAYVSGALSGETLERFESYYLASPRRREKVAFAKRLLAAVDRASASPTPPARVVAPAAAPAARASTPRETPRVRRAWFAWPVAAAALLALTCGTLFFEDAQLRRGLGEAQRLGAAANERARLLTQQLDARQAENAAMTQQLARIRTAEPVAAIALVLQPQTRGADAVPLIAVRTGGGDVSLDLQIETGGFDRYQASLKDPATARILWRSQMLGPRATARLSVVRVAIPANLLKKPQHYSLDLFGRRGADAPAIVGSYAFQVVPQ